MVEFNQNEADGNDRPLNHVDQWDDDVLRRYPEETLTRQLDASESAQDAAKSEAEFRDYDHSSERVREFYRLNHRLQTHEFVLAKRSQYLPLKKRRMSVWQAMEFLNTLVDDSDPDTELSQIQHLMQTAEAIRADGHPRWFILTGLIHDLGKILCLFGEPQWAVVGDTFPVGCKHSSKIVFAELFDTNPDSRNPRFTTELGIYRRHCGLDQVMMSWGHDEYLYHVVKDFLPEPALYMIRYHSFYAAHREHEYQHLMNDHDQEMFSWVRQFNPYDLYSKSDRPPDVSQLKPYYLQLIDEFFPNQIAW